MCKEFLLKILMLVGLAFALAGTIANNNIVVVWGVGTFIFGAIIFFSSKD